MTSSVNGARTMAGVSWRCVLYYAVGVAAVGGVAMAAAASGSAGIWPTLAGLLAATAAVATVHLARLPLRVGGDTMLLAWGEAGAIIAGSLVPPGWVPLAGLIGSAAAHGHRLLGAGHTQRVRVSYTIGVLTLGAAAAAGVLALTGDVAAPMHIRIDSISSLGWLCVAGLAYFATTSVLTSAWVARTTHTDLGRVWLRAARGKRLMLVASLAAGLGIGRLIEVDLRLIALLPPLAWGLRQVYGYQLRAAEDRRAWSLFADATRDLNRPDERGVVVAALRGAARLFSPEEVELVLFRPSGRRRRHVARASEISATGGEQRPISEFDEPSPPEVAPPDPSEPAAAGRHAVRRLFVAGAHVGELGLRFRRATPLPARDEHAFSAFAEAVSSALHDAATNRQLRAMTARNAYAAVHDTLTGLSNRSTLLAQGNAQLQRLPADAPVALVLFDVDRFHKVNETLSQAAGDELLRALARRLRHAQASDELLGRLGGDEYALLLTGFRAGEAQYPMERAHALAAALALPVEISGVRIAVEASAGVVVASAGECGMTELVRRANVALYQAKRSGPRVARYTRSAEVTSVDRLALLAELRDALTANGQIVLALQPAIDLATGAPTGVEALVRWHHPRRGVLAPSEFIAVMEHSDLVDAFTRYVINQALRISAGWATQGVHLPISVNLSARSLLDRDLPATVSGLLVAHGVPPRRLTLEITETAMVSDLAVIAEVVAGLRATGVQVSVDDFGTGFSSLKFLSRVPVDEVKIDRTFVAQLGASPEAAAIVRTTVDLAQQLGLRVVAEGVETVAQRAALAALGATAAQGHLFYPAMAVEQATAVLQGLTQSANARAIPIVRAPRS